MLTRCFGKPVLALLAASLTLFLPAPLIATEPLRPTLAAAPPVIDGRLDEEVWKQAPTVTGFKTWMPDFGADLVGETVVYYAYDAENMYFAFRALDSEPSKIKASMASRDSIRPDDWVCINLDSFNDQQALYAFYVNPLGIQMDSRFANNREDMGFDAVWYSAGAIDDRGYTIEIRIPFKSIRYGGKNPVTMGIIFERFVSRSREDGTYPPLDPKAGFNFQIQMIPIAFADIKRYTLLEVLPDAVYSRQDASVTGRLERVSSGPEAGVTAKYGVTAQLTLDGTYNPDFSQVESDAGQIDINRRSPLFYPEKRPFFLEGQDVFAVGGPSQEGPVQAVIHTRNIVNPLAGVKLSGKLARADTLTALYSPDERPATAIPAVGQAGYAHFEVLRYKRSLRQDSYLGGFYVGRERGDAFNRVAGADGTIRFNESDALGFYAFGSDTRPAGSSTDATGHAIGADFNHDTRNLTLAMSAVSVSTDFAAEAGYVTRTGLTSFRAYAVPKLYPKESVVRRVGLGVLVEPTYDAFSRLWEGSVAGTATVVFTGATTVSAGYRFSNEVYLGERFPTSGVNATASAQIIKQVRLQGTFSNGRAIYYPNSWRGRSTAASAALIYQPADQWTESLSLTYSNFDSAAGVRLYDYLIVRSRTSFQLNRYLFFRAVVEYNSFRRQIVTDLLASFTYIPGTVLHLGYGSLYERTRWDGSGYVPDSSYRELSRGLFFKASYLWRL